jgi:hypothetical protein
VVAGVAIAAAGCTEENPNAGSQFFPLIFQDIPAAGALRVQQPMTAVFRDQASWNDFWQANAPGGGSAPVADFNREMLIAVFWGVQPAGCTNFVNAIEAVGLRFEGVNSVGAVEVQVGPLPPLGSCATTVFPVQVVSTDRSGAQVVFVGDVPG